MSSTRKHILYRNALLSKSTPDKTQGCRAIRSGAPPSYGENTMSSNKIARINDDIQRVVSSKLRDIKDPRVQQGMISVTRVETTGDLRYSKIWLSVMGLENEKEFRRGIKSASGWLRREVGSVLNLRYTPELVFELDHSIEYGAHINDLISSLDIRQDGDSNDE